MSMFRRLLRTLGLSSDARVHINAPGIDVVITGDPDKVRAMFGAVKNELERQARPAVAPSSPKKPVFGLGAGALDKPRRAASSKMVRPTELDDMDSPYALPEARVVPVESARPYDQADTDEKQRQEAPGAATLQRLVQDLEATRKKQRADEEPEPEVTAVEQRLEQRIPAGDDAGTVQVRARNLPRRGDAFEAAPTLLPDEDPDWRETS